MNSGAVVKSITGALFNALFLGSIVCCKGK